MQRIKLLACTAALVGAGLVATGAQARLYAENELEVLWEDYETPEGQWWCGPGPGGKCKEVVVQRCSEWAVTGVGGSAGPTGGGINGSSTCGTWITTTVIWYWTPGTKPGE